MNQEPFQGGKGVRTCCGLPGWSLLHHLAPRCPTGPADRPTL